MKFLRYLLFPFALVYQWISQLRNYLYDQQILKSVEFDLPIMVVGNLSTGGTGKTPHIEYLVRLLQKKLNIAVLSRGYKRRSHGFLIANDTSTAMDIGDEPMQIHTKFPKITVAVGENRALAVPNILWEQPDVQAILMDDGFQHRSIQPSLSIVLTNYHHLFTRDYMLPVGNLREPRNGYQRTHAIVVTKCPDTISSSEKQQIIQEIAPLTHQKVFFSHLKYGLPYSISDSKKSISLSKEIELLLICGIARTTELQFFLKEKVHKVHTRFFGDHHYFSEGELKNIKTQFEKIQANQKIIVTTEKDAMRLKMHQQWLDRHSLPIYCLPVEVIFMGLEKNNFDDWLVNAIQLK